jgi:uncharacterized membrane protein HdeD (DUF308 family)
MSVFGVAIGIVSIIVGLLILIFPRFLRYAIGLYLIIAGIGQISRQSGVNPSDTSLHSFDQARQDLPS